MTIFSGVCGVVFLYRSTVVANLTSSSPPTLPPTPTAHKLLWKRRTYWSTIFSIPSWWKNYRSHDNQNVLCVIVRAYFCLETAELVCQKLVNIKVILKIRKRLGEGYVLSMTIDRPSYSNFDVNSFSCLRHGIVFLLYLKFYQKILRNILGTPPPCRIRFCPKKRRNNIPLHGFPR